MTRGLMNKSVVFFLFLFSMVSGFSFALDCPKMPEQINKDWEVEVNASIVKLGSIKGGELRTKTSNVTKDLLGKIPNAGKVYLEQMMYSAYCSALRDDKIIKESEKANLLRQYNREVRKTIAAVSVPVSKSTVKSSQSETEIKSLNELISLLDARFETIITEIEARKNNPNQLRACYDSATKIEEMETNLKTLHKKIKASLKKSEFVTSHELINDFQNKLQDFNVCFIPPPKSSYLISPEPGTDKDYDNYTSTVTAVRNSTNEKYPGSEVDLFLKSKITKK